MPSFNCKVPMPLPVMAPANLGAAAFAAARLGQGPQHAVLREGEANASSGESIGSKTPLQREQPHGYVAAAPASRCAAATTLGRTSFAGQTRFTDNANAVELTEALARELGVVDEYDFLNAFLDDFRGELVVDHFPNEQVQSVKPGVVPHDAGKPEVVILVLIDGFEAGKKYPPAYREYRVVVRSFAAQAALHTGTPVTLAVAQTVLVRHYAELSELPHFVSASVVNSAQSGRPVIRISCERYEDWADYRPEYDGVLVEYVASESA